MSPPHEAAIKQATPQALLPPEERTPEDPTPAASAASDKAGKGKSAKAKGKGAAASAGRKGSKGGGKPALEVRQWKQAQSSYGPYHNQSAYVSFRMPTFFSESAVFFAPFSTKL